MTKNFLGTPLIASEHGAGLDALTWYIHLLMAVLFVGWAIYFLYVLFRFRRTRNPQADHLGVQSHFSTYVEVGVAVTEAVLLIGFAVPLWARSVEKFPAEASSVVIRVTGRQFNWISRYAGADGTFGKQDVKFVSGANPLGLDVNAGGGKVERRSRGRSLIGLPGNTYVSAQLSRTNAIRSL